MILLYSPCYHFFDHCIQLFSVSATQTHNYVMLLIYILSTESSAQCSVIHLFIDMHLLDISWQNDEVAPDFADEDQPMLAHSAVYGRSWHLVVQSEKRMVYRVYPVEINLQRMLGVMIQTLQHQVPLLIVLALRATVGSAGD